MSTPTREPPVTAGTREAILDRAVDLASTDGLEGLTIGRLATELEMSKSGLFGHFGSKQELQLATIDAAERRFVEAVIEPALARPEGAARLRALCEHFIAYLEGPVFPGGCFWGAATAEFDGRPGPVRDRIRERFGAWLAELERQAGIAGADDPKQLVFELQALAQGANSSFQLFGDATVFERARRAMEALLPAAQRRKSAK
ncbi:MAG TPA: TetR/AcrR family transcriptional regulator [Solirubrobacterales bacterium]